MAKDSVFTMKLEAELRERFMAEAEALDRPASQIVREFMREFVELRRTARRHDTWFRAAVQEALDDPRPGVSRDRVVEEARAVIDRIAAEKAGA